MALEAEPAFSDIEAAAERLEGRAVVTPLVESDRLNERLGGRLLVKAETLQRTGSFKFRGAFNRMSMIDQEARRRGVVAYSSGNHAQGVAAAARILEIPAVIVMPEDAPAVKIVGTRDLGAEVVLYDRRRENREEIGRRIAGDSGATLIEPYDDPKVMAGQATVGLELASQAEAMGVRLDALLVPCSGGGLVAGCALALERKSPHTAVWAVEPEGFDDTARSLAAGRRLTNPDDARSFCDALLAPTPGQLTFAVNSRLLAGGLAVGDEAAAAAMATAFGYLDLVVEPGGAVALAAVLEEVFDCRGLSVAVVCSGGNVDEGTFRAALTGHESRR